MALVRSQRQAGLKAIFEKETAPRPLLTHINADASWLLSFPIPASDARRQSKSHFHILIDAWLTPSNSPLRIFLEQYHVEPYLSVSEVLDHVSDIEASSADSSTSPGQIDAILINSEGDDHANRETFQQIDASVPVFCPHYIIPKIKSWNHFDTIIPVPHFGENGQYDWRVRDDTLESRFLPKWLGLWRLAWDAPFPRLACATMIVYDPSVGGDTEELAQCIVNSTHGLKVEHARVVSEAEPVIETLALLHTTKESWAWGIGKGSMGAKNGLEVARELDAKRWVATHDEMVTSSGFYSYFLSDGQVLGEEAVEMAFAGEKSEKERPKFSIVGVGETLLLD